MIRKYLSVPNIIVAICFNHEHHSVVGICKKKFVTKKRLRTTYIDQRRYPTMIIV